MINLMVIKNVFHIQADILCVMQSLFVFSFLSKMRFSYKKL